MSLMKCPECGGNVSDRAAACPHCGCPVDQRAKQLEDAKARDRRFLRRAGALLLGGILLLLGIVILLANHIL